MIRKFVWVFLLILPAFLLATMWQVDLTVSDGSSDRILTFGVNPDATDGFDFGIDENFPLIPPSGLYAFFPLSDPTNPYVTMLTGDYRSDELDDYIWRGTVGGSAELVSVSWSAAGIPTGDAFIGIGTADTEPEEWSDMTGLEEIGLYAGQFFWINYTSGDTGDVDNPPYIVSTYPENGAISVPTTAEIQITLGDDETGIDVETIELIVNSVDVSEYIDVTRDGDYWVVSYEPAGGLPPDEMVIVSITAYDIGAVPNFVDYSFWFQTAPLLTLVEWEVPIRLHNISFAGDTTEFDLLFGAAEDASDMFDIPYDVPYPSPPAGVFYAYFPLVDPLYEFSMLTRDIRSSEIENTWSVRMGNPGVTIWATWDIDDLPDETDLEIAKAFPPTEPEEWLPMDEMETFSIIIGQWIWVRQHIEIPPDETPPYLVSSIPTIAATAIPPETEMTVIIADAQSGVDVSTIVFIVDGEDVTDSATIIESDGYVYIHYIPAEAFPVSTRIDWSVTVSDLAVIPNEAEIPGYFTTGFYPTPLWMIDVNLNIEPFDDDSSVSSITFGVDEAGTDLFDIGLDYLFAPPPPGSPSFYFNIDDTLWGQLMRDIRSSFDDSILWVSHFTSIDSNYAEFTIDWDPDEFPASGAFMYAVTDLVSDPVDWFSMRDEPSYDITTDGRLFIMYKSEIPTYCLSGTVTLEGEDSLAGTTIEIEELEISTTTDDSGYYEICNLNSGTYNVIFTHDGFATQEEEIVILDDMTYDVHLLLARYTVSGIVIPEGIPEGERDSITVSLGFDIVYTDEDGNFTFPDILPGTYPMHIEYDGFFPIDTIIDVVDEDVYLEFDLFPAQYTVSGWIELEGEDIGYWDGTIITMDGREDTTDENGNFEFTGVSEAEYNLHAENLPDFISIDTLFYVDYNISLELILKRAAPELGTIRVTVSLEDGGDPEDIEVILVELNDTNYTNPMGRTRFRDIPYDDYILEINHPGYISEFVNVTLDSPEETVDVMLYLPRGVIHGYVYLDDDPPDLSGSDVTLDSSIETITDEDGYYIFEDVVLGEHSLDFEHTDYIPADSTIFIALPDTFEVTVTLYTQPPLNPPQDLNIISAMHNRVSVRWNPPEPSTANLVGYGLIRRFNTEPEETLAYIPGWSTGYIDYDAESAFYWYQVFSVYEEGNSESIGGIGDFGWGGDDPADPDVLIIDFDNGALLADGATVDEDIALQQIFTDGEVVCDVTTQDQQLTDIENLELFHYKTVFIITGIYDDDNEVLSEGTIAYLFDYLGAGGRLYWEGADIGYDYTPLWDGALMDVLGIEFADDGRPRGGGNVLSLIGQAPFFDGNPEFDYDYQTIADHYIDEFFAIDDAMVMLRSQSEPAPNESDIRTIAYELDLADYGFTTIYKTVTSSVYLGAMQGHDYYKVLESVWFFLTGEELEFPGIDDDYSSKVPRVLNLTLAPTPFNSSLEISVDIDVSGQIELVVEDITGRVVERIYGGQIAAGTQVFHWNADNNAPSGTYLVILRTDNAKVMRKAALIK